MVLSALLLCLGCYYFLLLITLHHSAQVSSFISLFIGWLRLLLGGPYWTLNGALKGDVFFNIHALQCIHSTI